uniref:Uncharacterized protein n=1 Tax=Rhizophora mucronata TaxID=61149 RepID=A0A2P2JME6_RHIMU
MLDQNATIIMLKIDAFSFMQPKDLLINLSSKPICVFSLSTRH